MPLEGTKIVDFTIWLQSFGVAMLGDMGADVWKVEELPDGDPLRNTANLRTLQYKPLPKVNFRFETTCRNKRSVAVDVKSEEGKELIRRLAAQADVFVSNRRRAALEKWGLGYERLSALNPRLIYAIDSGWGPKGPDRDLPGMDMAVQARGGLMSQMGDAGTPPPAWGVPTLADKVGALQLAYGITMALLARERTGLGQELNVSLLGGQVTAGAFMLAEYLTTGEDPPRVDRMALANPLRCTLETRDGRWISFNLTESDRHWPNFCRALGLEHLMDDPRFNTADARRTNSRVLTPMIMETFATRTKDEWVSILPEYGLVFGPVQNYAEVAADPQVVENEYIATVPHPEVGPMRVLGLPVQLSKTPGSIRRTAPRLGEHTDEVLRQAGFAPEEIEGLRARGVVKQAA